MSIKLESFQYHIFMIFNDIFIALSPCFSYRALEFLIVCNIEQSFQRLVFKYELNFSNSV